LPPEATPAGVSGVTCSAEEDNSKTPGGIRAACGLDPHERRMFEFNA